MDCLKFIPGVEREYIFDSTDSGEVTAIVTACKVANVKHKLYKKNDGTGWRVVYTIKDTIQKKFEEVVSVYRDVKHKIA